VIELHFLLFSTFLGEKTLYFWSVFAAMWGVALNGLAVVLKTFILTERSTVAQINVVIAVLILGWYLMVTGQSLVLYSRLHIVVYNSRVTRGVLAMIIFSAITLHIPITIIVFAMTNDPTGPYVKVYNVYEPLQLTMFAVQEVIISAIYIYYAAKMLRPMQNIHGRKALKTIRNLICINLLIIALDITLVSLQYARFDVLQHFFKACVYSVKLKIEFVVLNQLLDLTQNPKSLASQANVGDNTKATGQDSQNTYNSFAGADDIALTDVKNHGVVKAIGVVNPDDRTSSPQTEGERRRHNIQALVGLTTARSGQLSPSSSQVRLAEAAF
jgi:hypothetical protein